MPPASCCDHSTLPVAQVHGPQTPSALKSYDLVTGTPRGSYAMPASGYCNDLAQDARGNLYVTDSFHPRVLRLAPGAAALEVWKEDPLLAGGTAPYRGLNGIALDGDRDVYVSLVEAASHVLHIPLGADGHAGEVRRIDGTARPEEHRRDPGLETRPSGAVRKQRLREAVPMVAKSRRRGSKASA